MPQISPLLLPRTTYMITKHPSQALRPGILLINILRPHTLHHILRRTRRYAPLLRDQLLQKKHNILRHASVAAAIKVRFILLQEAVYFLRVRGEVVLHVVLFRFVGAGEGCDHCEVGAEGALSVLESRVSTEVGNLLPQCG